MSAPCPLCGDRRSRIGWAGSTQYRGHSFTFRQCLGCGSQFCDPMPDAETLRLMYGSSYAEAFAGEPTDDDSKQPAQTLEWLARLGRGTFVDFGCGDGSLLERARDLGWRAIGVELDEEVAARVRRRTGLDVFTDIDALAEGSVDALHLGDVIEHLTDPDRELPRILRVLKRDGHLIAQGPLEANASLFTWAIRAGRLLRRPPARDGAPYHVMLATAAGQRRLFERKGIREVAFTVREVAWPAASRWSDAARRGARGIALYGLRRVSRALSRIDSARLGNRYFFVGQRTS